MATSTWSVARTPATRSKLRACHAASAAANRAARSDAKRRASAKTTSTSALESTRLGTRSASSFTPNAAYDSAISHVVQRRLVEPHVRVQPVARRGLRERVRDQHGLQRVRERVLGDQRVVALVPRREPEVRGRRHAQAHRRQNQGRQRSAHVSRPREQRRARAGGRSGCEPSECKSIHAPGV